MSDAPIGGPRPRALGAREQVMIAGGAIAALVVALGLARGVHHAQEPPPAQAPPRGVFRATPEELANIAVAPVQVRPFAAEVAGQGKIALDEDRTTQIFPPVSGRVTRVYVTAGEAVPSGAPLIAFAATEPIQAASDLANARAAERQARAQLAQAKAAYARQSMLLKGDAAAQRDVDQALTDVQAASQALTAARTAATAAAARAMVLQLAPRPQAAQGGNAAAPLVGQAILKSPFAGVVTQRQVGEGQFVNSVAEGASQPLLTVSDTRHVWLVVELRDADADAVQPGDPVEARVDAVNGEVISGRVSRVSPLVDPAARRVQVRAEIDNPDGRLRPEMFVEARIVTGPARRAVAIPQSAVVFDGPSARVWVARPHGEFALRQVRLGREADGLVEVLSGLAAGERVATGGALFLDEAGKDGA